MDIPTPRGHDSGSAPLVSIIIPTHNRWPLVLEAVDSALAQEVEGVEVVVVDDGSTDGTADLLEVARPGISVLRQTNRERGAARNAGMRHARGRYVTFLDADDVLEPWYVAQFVERWASAGGRESIYVSPATTWYPEMVRAQRKATTTGRVPPSLSTTDALLRRALRGTIWGVMCAVVPRETALSVGGFPEAREAAGSEDWVFHIRMLASGLSVEFLPCPAARIREHPLRSTNDAQARIAGRQAALRELLETELPGRPLSAAERRLAIAGTHRFCAAQSYRLGDMPQARSYLVEVRHQVGLRVAAPWCGRLWIQTWLGARGSALVRRVRDYLR